MCSCRPLNLAFDVVLNVHFRFDFFVLKNEKRNKSEDAPHNSNACSDPGGNCKATGLGVVMFGTAAADVES